MLRALLFDMGGTLDGDGDHWLDRFDAAYTASGLHVSRERLRAAFDRAERLAAADADIQSMGFEAMVTQHVAWQVDSLPDAAPHAADIVRRFVEPVRRIAVRNASLLAALKSDGYILGVVSNGCGNVDRLCDDFGYTSSLSLVVDSRRVGLHKPDPAIFTCASSRLGIPPAAIMMIGDSFDRDIRPAASIGLKTAWLQGAGNQPCPDPSVVDVFLGTLTELPRALEARARTVA